MDLREKLKNHQEKMGQLFEEFETFRDSLPENEDWTSEQRKKFDQYDKEVDDLDKEIDLLKRSIKLEDLEKRYSEPDDNGISGLDLLMDSDSRTRGSITPKEGEVFAYRHGQSLPASSCKPDERDLNLGLMLRGLTTGNWDGADRERRAMSSSNDVLGGYLLPAPMSNKVIDLARNKSVVSAAGALTVPMKSSTLKITKILTDPTGYWRAENQAITESAPTFGALNFTAKTLGALCRIPIELIEDTENVGNIVQQAIAKALALELDRVALFGSGSGAEPIGLYNTSDVQENTPSTDGDTLTNYDVFSWSCTALHEHNCQPKSVVYAPRTHGTIDRFKDTSNQPLNPPESFKNLKKLVSNQVPIDMVQGSASNATTAILGDFSNLLIGMRKQVIIEATRTGGDDAFSKMQVLIRAYLRADVQVARADHFYLIKGLILD